MNTALALFESQLPVSLSRKAIDALESIMVALPKEQQIESNNRHDFCPGVYARTIFMPADTVIISKVHKTKHFFVVSQGSCTVKDSHGVLQLITAPHLGVTEPGTKRALHIHEDCIWTTFHVTDKTDLAEIEDDIMLSAEVMP